MGSLEVTADYSNVTGNATESNLFGSRFVASLALGADCDGPAASCAARHESYFLPSPGPVDRTWRWTDLGQASSTAVFTTKLTDDCVDETGEVVGDFATTITETVVLREPAASATGELVWTVAAIAYEENAVSDDHEQDCYTSTYRAEGTLRRSR